MHCSINPKCSRKAQNTLWNIFNTYDTDVKTKLSFVKANVFSREDAGAILFNVNTKLQNVKTNKQTTLLVKSSDEA